MHGARIAVACALVAAVAAPASADPDPSAKQTPAYETAFTDGRARFEDGDYAGARTRFEDAYAIYPEPLLLFNIGSTYRREGNLAEAITYYERFLADAAPNDPLRPIATELIADLRKQIAARNRPDPPPPPAPPPPSPSPSLSPSPTPPTDTATATDTAPPRPGRTWRIAGIATSAAGAVALAVGIQQGLRARSISADIENAPTGTEFTPELAARYDDGETAERRAIALTATGTVAIAAGVTLYVIGQRKARRSRRRVVVSPWTTGDHTGIAITGRF